MNKQTIITRLLELSHDFGANDFAILGEGNNSARVSEETFVVKASGSNLRSLSELELTECRFDRLLPALKREETEDDEVEHILLDSRVNPTALKPSVETFFHADLLTLPGVNFVGHTHPIAVNQILCSPLAADFAERRSCPDEVVCCGPISLLVQYEDPGLTLARRIHRKARKFTERHGLPPRVILLANHGVITLGATAEAVRVAMHMTVKAAEIFVGAHSLGGVVYLPQKEVERIGSRVDEAYRQKMLRM
jgi:rhamnose utilization protein RhaD (predicted bifunctional aldolase and dehydrogenase)